jgi:tetrapyrrole methylase family protein/MazG family protein
VEIMAKLRGEKGCPWDREQTHEEAYEVLEALDQKNFEHLCEELGDLLLQVVFHARLGQESGTFTIEDVLESINSKLIRRHPHVFGDTLINSSEEQRVHWERLKKHEGKESVLDGVPATLPALLQAHRTQQKASTVGFDWEKQEQVWEKVQEELDELKQACSEGDEKAMDEEMGDLLFALVNLSRFIRVNPEESLRRAVGKFYRRFRNVEEFLKSQGKSMEQATLEEMDNIWNRLK